MVHQPKTETFSQRNIVGKLERTDDESCPFTDNLDLQVSNVFTLQLSELEEPFNDIIKVI